jgi:hypothetical protein
VVDSFAADGFLIDQGQAVADARQILAEPHITAALDILAELLLAERELDGARIEDVLRSHHPDRHPTPPAWIPGRRLPNVAAHRDSAASPITGRTPSSVHQAADKPSRSTSLSRLTALAERISAESQQRAASRPPADSAGESKSSIRARTEPPAACAERRTHSVARSPAENPTPHAERTRRPAIAVPVRSFARPRPQPTRVGRDGWVQAVSRRREPHPRLLPRPQPGSAGCRVLRALARTARSGRVPCHPCPQLGQALERAGRSPPQRTHTMPTRSASPLSGPLAQQTSANATICREGRVSGGSCSSPCPARQPRAPALPAGLRRRGSGHRAGLRHMTLPRAGIDRPAAGAMGHVQR